MIETIELHGQPVCVASIGQHKIDKFTRDIVRVFHEENYAFIYRCSGTYVMVFVVSTTDATKSSIPMGDIKAFCLGQMMGTSENYCGLGDFETSLREEF